MTQGHNIIRYMVDDALEWATVPGGPRPSEDDDRGQRTTTGQR